jgi:MFS superfamily sulfate permease-like transporter
MGWWHSGHCGSLAEEGVVLVVAVVVAVVVVVAVAVAVAVAAAARSRQAMSRRRMAGERWQGAQMRQRFSQITWMASSTFEQKLQFASDDMAARVEAGVSE